jgi:hypothetical protein
VNEIKVIVEKMKDWLFQAKLERRNKQLSKRNHDLTLWENVPTVCCFAYKDKFSCSSYVPFHLKKRASKDRLWTRYLLNYSPYFFLF